MADTTKEKLEGTEWDFAFGRFDLGTSGFHPHRRLLILIFCLFFLTGQLIIHKLIAERKKQSFCFAEKSLRCGIQALIILGMTKRHVWENQMHLQTLFTHFRWIDQTPCIHTQCPTSHWHYLGGHITIKWKDFVSTLSCNGVPPLLILFVELNQMNLVSLIRWKTAEWNRSYKTGNKSS